MEANNKVNILCDKLPFIASDEKTPVDFSVLIDITKHEWGTALFSMIQIELSLTCSEDTHSSLLIKR